MRTTNLNSTPTWSEIERQLTKKSLETAVANEVCAKNAPTDSELINAIDLYSEWWRGTRVHPKRMNVSKHQAWLRKVLTARLLDRLSLSVVARKANITPERVRQIEFQFRRYASRNCGIKLFDWKTYKKVNPELAKKVPNPRITALESSLAGAEKRIALQVSEISELVSKNEELESDIKLVSMERGIEIRRARESEEKVKELEAELRQAGEALIRVNTSNPHIVANYGETPYPFMASVKKVLSLPLLKQLMEGK